MDTSIHFTTQCCKVNCMRHGIPLTLTGYGKILNLESIIVECVNSFISSESAVIPFTAAGRSYSHSNNSLLSLSIF